MTSQLLPKFIPSLGKILNYKQTLKPLCIPTTVNINRQMSIKLDIDPAKIWSTLPNLPYEMTKEEEIEDYFELNKKKYRSALPNKPEFFEVVTVDEYNKGNEELASNSPFIARVRNDEGIVGAVNLIPYIYETPTRSDILFDAFEWERRKGLIDHTLVRNQFEMLWSKRKLWPQKGSGRAAISHRGSSLHIDGGKAIGKRPKDLTIKIPPEKLRYAFRSILATRYRETDSKSLIIDTQVDDNHQFFNEDLASINRVKYGTCFNTKIKDFCKFPKLYMTLRALDFYDKLLKFDGIPYNHPNYDTLSDDFQVVEHFMKEVLATPPKINFHNAVLFKNDGQCQSSRKYVPSDASRHKFQERLQIMEEKQQQLWLTYRRPKFEKKPRY